MKKVAIVSGISTNGLSTAYAEKFADSISNYQFVDINFDHLIITISPQKFEVVDGRTGESLDHYDLVMIREYQGRYQDVAYVLSKFLSAADIPFFNQNYLTYRPISKVAQAVIFYEQGVGFPLTCFSLNSKYVTKELAPLGFPLIIKDSMGMHGSDNFLIHSAEELDAYFAKDPYIKFLAQEFLPNTHDYRVLIMGDQKPLQLKRTAAPGSHLNNTSQGGVGEVVNELPETVLNDAIRLAKAFNLDIAGIDVVQSQKDHQYYFLEVNTQPQIVTGAATEQKIAIFKKFIENYLA